MIFILLYDNFILMNKVSHLVCIRHGESVWNAKGLWTGWQDVSLSSKGKEEARQAAFLLKDIKFDIAFTSDLKRAYQTLEIIKEELSLNIPTIKEPAFKERHYGIYTGKNKWEIQKSLGVEKFKKLRRGWNESIPEGESLKDVYQRVMKHFHKHLRPAIARGLNILFVTHGNTNRALIKYIEKIPDNQIAEVEMATGEVIIYRLNSQCLLISKERRKYEK